MSDGQVRPHQGTWRGWGDRMGPRRAPLGSRWLSSPACLLHRDLLGGTSPQPTHGRAGDSLGTWIACDRRRPPTEETALPASPGYCGERVITQVCFPQGATLPLGLIFNFYILIKNRSNGGGLSGETRFRQEAGHAPLNMQSHHRRRSKGGTAAAPGPGSRVPGPPAAPKAAGVPLPVQEPLLCMHTCSLRLRTLEPGKQFSHCEERHEPHCPGACKGEGAFRPRGLPGLSRPGGLREQPPSPLCGPDDTSPGAALCSGKWGRAGQSTRRRHGGRGPTTAMWKSACSCSLLPSVSITAGTWGMEAGCSLPSRVHLDARGAVQGPRGLGAWQGNGQWGTPGTPELGPAQRPPRHPVSACSPATRSVFPTTRVSPPRHPQVQYDGV